MTDNINWQVKTFNQLNTNELYDLLKLRIDVFVVEQTCYYSDLDELDRHPQTLHLFNYSNSKLASYLRILPKGLSYENYISIGRVIIAPQARGQGLGHQLIQQALTLCEQHFPNQTIKISAQEHLQGFYQHHGFKSVGDVYLEDDIPHIGMIK